MERRIAFLLWMILLPGTYGDINSAYTGVDIGHSCKSDAECTTGNGGEYSKCHSVLSICICTISIQGEDRCSHDSDHYYNVCRPQTIYQKLGQCTLECSSKGTKKWRDNEDWYGEIKEYFTNQIHDKKTSVCYDPGRAFNSVPDGFEIKQSTIPGAGLGSFTNVYVEQDTVFGPYKGIFEPDTDEALVSGYSWKIEPRLGEGFPDVVWVDAKDVSQSNWIRYSNTPTSAEMENLVAVQFKGEIYYQAFKYIPPGSELFVWYGESYGEYLEIEKFDPPRYYYAKPGYAGGSCHEDYEGTPCQYDDNTVCADKTCFCLPGTHIRAGRCITDETLGGICTGSDGETCKKDTNAECHRGVCVCKNNTTPANRACRQDEAFGGRCAQRNGEKCLLDNNTECVHGICRCRYGTTGINGKCMIDETYQGRCIGEDGDECDYDINTECIDKLCVCKANASAIEGRCQMDEMVGGTCKDVDGKTCALDKNAECVDGICQCKLETSNIDGLCRVDEKLGGRCNSDDGAACRIDGLTVCVKGICSCKEGMSDVGGICITDGVLSGMCVEGQCKGENVLCDSESNTCVCQPMHFSNAGKCVKERKIRRN